MTELIEKYFHGELTEAEEETLSAQLMGSDDVAQQFGSKAQDAYKRFGLPEPKWPGPSSVGSSLTGSSLWKLSFVVVLIAGVAFWYFNRSKVGQEASVPQNDTQVTALPTAQIEVVNKVGKKVSKKAPSAAIKEAVTAPVAKIADPGDPPPIGDSLKETYSDLQVIVNLKAPGSIRVRVLDLTGTEVRKLYEGQMQPGRWAFEWDGILSNGLAAQSGQYQIEVQSEGVTKKKSLLIH